MHPISKTSWEGVGVAPSVEAAPAQALEVAHSLALQRLSEQAGVSEENIAEYVWAKAAVDASLHPVTYTPDQLRSLAGSYGAAKVEFREGALWLTRPNRPVVRLLPLTADGLFMVERSDTLRVKLNGTRWSSCA